MSVVLETGARATTNAASRGTRIAENAKSMGVSGALSEAVVISLSTLAATHGNDMATELGRLAGAVVGG